MRRKGYKPAASRRPNGSRSPVGTTVWVLAGGLLLLLLILIVNSMLRHNALIAWRLTLEEAGAVAAWPGWDPTWPPLPKPRVRTTAFAGDLSGPYAFAALNHETLKFIPCYCGCRREGHQSVLSCFVKGRTLSGAPSWTDHAFTCQTCVNIVRETMLMSQRGMSLRDIRSAIDEHHGGLFSRSTATPLPK